MNRILLSTSFFALLSGALGCGGSESSDTSSDSGAPPADTGIVDSGVRDSGADTFVPFDTAVTDTTDATPPIDAPPGKAQLRIANMLWFPTSTNVHVCLVDSTTGASTLVEPAGVSGGLPYQTVTRYFAAPTGSNFTVHLVDAGGDCSSPAIIASGSPLDAPIEDGKTYLLAIAREPGEGDYAMVRLLPDLGPPSGAGKAVTRAFDMIYGLSPIDVSLSWGTTLVFSSLTPGNVPTSSSGGTPSPEGYVDGAGDVSSVDVTITGGAPIGHFPMGFFFTARNTYYVTGAPPGGAVPPQIVYCHDDLSVGTFTRCDTISAGP